jgi:hypothetical protein
MASVSENLSNRSGPKPVGWIFLIAGGLLIVCLCSAILGILLWTQHDAISNLIATPTFTPSPTTRHTPTFTPSQTPTITLSLPAVEEWEQVFASNFVSSDVSYWLTGHFENQYAVEDLDILNGKYRWDATAKRGFVRWGYPEIDPVFDFYLSVECQQMNLAVEGACGLVFRLVDSADYYMFGIDSMISEYYVRMQREGEWSDLISSTPSEAIQPEQPNQISVLGQGSYFIFYINGTIVGEIQDDAFESGYVGVIIELFDAGAHSAFEFDNFVLRVP